MTHTTEPATTEEVDLRQYELMFILSGDLAEREFEVELGEVKKIINESIDKITYEESWGRRNLMHKIKKQRHGYYILMNFMADPAKIMDLNMNLKIYPAVLRHLMMVMPNSYVPGSYKTVAFKPDEVDEEGTEQQRGVSSRKPSVRPRREMPGITVKDVQENEVVTQEKMKKVEKKLEQILENPDIDVR
ncbi:30S ribosomal protein S6 [Candidatus Gracilibacteria bacterium]|nr:30S ribosomal protein S6 [Candidatus Gracilibacteria bacterium]